MSFRNPQVASSGGGATITDVVELCKIDGSRSYYDTIAAAETAASANEILNCYGTFNEANLGKNGLGYYFPPAAGITSTVDWFPIFADEGKGVIEFKVDGQGTFISNTPNVTTASVLKVQGASTVVFEGAVARHNLASACAVFFTNAGGTIKADVDYVRQNMPNAKTVDVSGGRFFAKFPELSSAGYGIQTQGLATIEADIIDCASRALWSYGELHAQVKRITTSSTSLPAIAITNGSDSFIEVVGRVVAAGPVLDVSGTGKVQIEGVLKTTHASAAAIQVANDLCAIEGGARIITGGGDAIAPSDASPHTVALTADIASNAAKSADITLVGGAITTNAIFA